MTFSQELERTIKEFIPIGDYQYVPDLVSVIIQLVKEIVPKEKKKIDITRKMCFNLEFPTDCLYDKSNPNGATCLMQDKNIPKEKCSDYKDMQIEYEDFFEWNTYRSEMLKKLEV